VSGPRRRRLHHHPRGGRTWPDDNIVSFVRFQLASNIGAILTTLGAQLLGLATPLTPIQILWVNLIMDGPPAMALGVDPARHYADHPEIRPRRSWTATGSCGCCSRGWHGSWHPLFRWGSAVRPDDDGAFAITLAFTTFVAVSASSTPRHWPSTTGCSPAAPPPPSSSSTKPAAHHATTSRPPRSA
jgi:hypothetical protein